MVATATEQPHLGRTRGALGIQWAAVSWTPLAHLLGTASLSAGDWGVVTLGILCPVLLLEALKAVRVRVGPR
jgi:hypothetical protein